MTRIMILLQGSDHARTSHQGSDHAWASHQGSDHAWANRSVCHPTMWYNIWLSQTKHNSYQDGVKMANFRTCALKKKEQILTRVGFLVDLFLYFYLYHNTTYTALAAHNVYGSTLAVTKYEPSLTNSFNVLSATRRLCWFSYTQFICSKRYKNNILYLYNFHIHNAQYT